MGIKAKNILMPPDVEQNKISSVAWLRKDPLAILCNVYSSGTSMPWRHGSEKLGGRLAPRGSRS